LPTQRWSWADNDPVIFGDPPRRAATLAIAAAFAAVIAGCEPPSVPGSAKPIPSGVQAARVERVVDGDTIAVRALAEGPVLRSTAQVTVRLLEIDTPETKRPGTPVQCFGPEAAAFTEHLLPVGAEVWVLPDQERRDRYGRDLLYVWTSTGVFANREIVRTGHATAVLYAPNDLYIEQIRDAESEARSANRGLWAACDLHSE
jgi:micrococcal nuclease